MYNDKKWHSFHRESIPRSFWYSLVFACAFFGGYVVYLCSKNDPQIGSLPQDVSVALAALAGFVLSWVGVKRSPGKHSADFKPLPLDRRLHFWIPLAFSIALLCQVLGNSLFIAYDLLGIEGPPLWGMLAIQGAYPAFLAGILLLPRNILSGKVLYVF